MLELLIAVPAHVMARRRHDCSAPMATSFGIATGIAIMLLSFGPSVLLLYAKRANEYATAKQQRRPVKWLVCRKPGLAGDDFCQRRTTPDFELGRLAVILIRRHPCIN